MEAPKQAGELQICAAEGCAQAEQPPRIPMYQPGCQILYRTFTQEVLFALNARIPGGGPPSRKGKYDLDKTVLTNRFYVQAQTGYKYWPYDKNDPFTPRSPPIQGRSLLKKNPA